LKQPADGASAPTLRLVSDDRPTVIEFQIGEAFPSDAPVARWLTALAMSHNDVRHGNLRLLEADEDDAATRLYYLRLVAGHFYEIAGDLKRDRDEWQEVRAFINGLSAQARRDLDHVIQGADQLDRRLGIVRNTAFHYLELNRRDAAKGREKLQQALTDASGLTGRATVGGDFKEIRFHFADEVLVQLLGDDREMGALLEGLQSGVVALWRFVHAAFKRYLNELPEGVLHVVPPPGS
jgi:hypothetical protein